VLWKQGSPLRDANVIPLQAASALQNVIGTITFPISRLWWAGHILHLRRAHRIPPVWALCGQGRIRRLTGLKEQLIRADDFRGLRTAIIYQSPESLHHSLPTGVVSACMPGLGTYCTDIFWRPQGRKRPLKSDQWTEMRAAAGSQVHFRFPKSKLRWEVFRNSRPLTTDQNVRKYVLMKQRTRVAKSGLTFQEVRKVFVEYGHKRWLFHHW
jgi:hypothetical protein